MTTPYLPGIDLGARGERFIRLPVVARSLPGNLKDLFEVLLDRYRDPGTPIVVSNERLAKELGCSVGNVRRNLGLLKRRPIPGKDCPFIRIESDGPKRQIYILAYPKEGRRTSNFEARLGARPGRAPSREKARAQGARLENRKSKPSKPVAAKPPLEEFRDRLNVNVDSISENPPAHAREARTTEPVASPTPGLRPPVIPPAAPPVDGIDRELDGLGADQLRAKIASLEAATKDPRPTIRIRANAVRVAARSLLAALEGAGEPATTSKVESIVARPAAAPAAKPAAPARPTVQTLLGRLSRVAGPAPIEEFAARMAEDLRDGQSVGYWRQVGERIRRGELRPARFWDGYRKAMNGLKAGTARKPGAILIDHIQRE